MNSTGSTGDVGSIDAILNSRLNAAINKVLLPTNPNNAPDLKKIMKQEISTFDVTNELGPHLTRILNSLKTIQPTSTESERAFSSSANFCTKRRARLSDKALNTLCFLKSFFLEKKQ